MQSSRRPNKKIWPAAFTATGLGLIVIALFRLFAGNGIPLIIALLTFMVGLAILLKGIDSLHVISSKTHQPERSMGKAVSLNKWITVLGVVNTFVFGFYAIASFGLSPLIPFVGPGKEGKEEFADQLARSFSFLGESVSSYLRGQDMLAQREIWLTVYLLPLIISTGIFIVLLILLSRHHETLESRASDQLYRWASVFALVYIFALPVLVMDFWHPIAWGRMIVGGLNPYYSEKTLEFMLDLPVRNPERMMYGPMWAVAYGAVAWVFRNPFVSALIFKSMLAAAWIGSLRLVRTLLEKASPWHQCLGLAIIGWIPLGVMQGVAEGHNDVFMIFFLLLWLSLLERGRVVKASMALAASVLVKYVTAPVFFLDFLYFFVSLKGRAIDYFKRLVPATLMVLLFVGLFYRSPKFFQYLTETSTWHFYSPKEGVATLLGLFGVWFPYTGRIVRLTFILIPVLLAWVYLRHPSQSSFRNLLLASLMAMLFGVSSHVWPWYLIWVLAIAAVIPGSALSRWVIGISLAMPFPILMWVVFPDSGDFWIFEAPALLVYAFAVLWFLFVPKRWFPDALQDSLQFSSEAKPI